MKFNDFMSIFWGIGNTAYTPHEPFFLKYIVPWVEDLEKGLMPVILPRYFKNKLYFYVFYTSKMETTTKEYLKDFVGAYDYITFADFDPIDNACLTFSNHNCLKFMVKNTEKNDPQFNQKVFNQVIRFRSIINNMPTVKCNTLNLPIGQLISNFRLALRQKNEKQLWNYYSEIKKTKNFSWLNLIFLKIQIFQTLGQWYKIYSFQELPDLIQTKVRPRTITSAIFTAMYEVELSSFVINKDYDGLITVFKEKILHEYYNLFSYRGKLESPEIVKVFLLKELCSGHPNTEEVNRLEFINPQDECILELVLRCKLLMEPSQKEPGEKKNLFEQAMIQKNEFNLDAAYSLLKQCNLKDTKVLVNLLAIAVNSENTDDEELLFLSKCYEELSEASKREISRNIHANRFVDKIHKKVELLETIFSWSDWAEKLLSEKENFEKYISIANMNSCDWGVSLYKNATDRKKFEGYLERIFLDDEKRFVIKESVADLINSFIDKQDLQTNFKKIYCIIFDTLTYGEHSEPVTIFEIFEYLLNAGLSNLKEYRQIVFDLVDVWEQIKSPKTINLGLDALESLLMYPDPTNRELSTLLFASVLGEFSKPIGQKIPLSTWQYFGELCKSFDSIEEYTRIYPTVTEDQKNRDDEIRKYLSGKMIAIYTLVDNVSHKVKQILQAKFPDTEIKVSNACGNTPELENMARNADIFIFTATAAKHAAYYAVKNNREKELLYPRGKGVSSMVACLDEYLDKILDLT